MGDMHYLQILSRKREVRNLHIKFRLIKGNYRIYLLETDFYMGN